MVAYPLLAFAYLKLRTDPRLKVGIVIVGALSVVVEARRLGLGFHGRRACWGVVFLVVFFLLSASALGLVVLLVVAVDDGASFSGHLTRRGALGMGLW